MSEPILDALPAGWSLSASAFNWTPLAIRAERTAADLAVGIVADGIAELIEVEAGQVWRSYPEPSDAEVADLAERLDVAGGVVSIVGASIDDWSSPTRRRDDDERFAFVLPQLHAAARVGATGVRLPIGHAGPELLRRAQPVLHELGITWFEEAQGQQALVPGTPELEVIAELDDPHVRLLVDISMLMPAAPVSYLERIAGAGLPADLVTRVRDEWRDPSTGAAVMAALRAGAVPPPVRALFMDLVVRFGRSSARDLRDWLPLVGAFHLKFWDLDDSDGRVTTPIRELGAELAGLPFAGTLCSEWGGHAWLDDDPSEMTRAHLGLARAALADGVGLTPRGGSTARAGTGDRLVGPDPGA